MSLLYRLVYFVVVRLLLPILHGVSDKVSRGYKLRQPVNGVLPWLSPPKDLHPLWIHCASGEFEYALPVIREIKKKDPTQKILVTYFTPTYVERMQAEPLVDFVLPAPWDEPAVIKAFIDHHQPKALLFSRTDVWREMSRQCSIQKIPVVVFSMTFQKKINLMLRAFFRWRWQFVNQFWVVSKTDADHLRALLPKAQIDVVGDSRYDQCLFRLSLNKPLPFSISQNSAKLIVAGSTWPEDEDVLVPAIAKLRELRWVVVPHENSPSHLAQLERKLQAHDVTFIRSSSLSTWDGTKILIVDQVGFLAELYRHADLSFVGGSFRKQVHSVMEPLACGCLTFVGPLYKNNREAIQFSSEYFADSLSASSGVTLAEDSLAPVQIIRTLNQLTTGIERVVKQWTHRHRDDLMTKIIQNSGASQSIASKILKI